jgi:sortase (surface protein transpeptidase)
MTRGDRLVAWSLDATAISLAIAFLFLAGRSTWMGAKSLLAEHLIARAFSAHVRDGDAHVPWSWADVHPVASLEVPRLGIRRHVLTGASGSSLAFGIGHLDGTSPPNGNGNCVLVGHRIDLLEATSSRLLTLMTCYPFNGLTPGAQRFVVWCRPGHGPEFPGKRIMG